MFRIDVTAKNEPAATVSNEEMTVQLLRQLVVTQQKQTKLLGDLDQQNAALHKQRAGELQQWKNANPELSRACRRAAETLSEVQTEFLQSVTEEIDDSSEYLAEGEYMLNEFIDRFGPRMAHLNGILQVLAQLGTGEPVAEQQQQ
jgi:DNA repair ATPase RecN